MKLFTPVVALLTTSDVAGGSLRATKTAVLVKAPMMRKFHLLICWLDWILFIADAQSFNSNVSINLTATGGVVALPHVAKALAVAHQAKEGGDDAFTCSEDHHENHPVCPGHEDSHYCDGRGDCRAHPDWCSCAAGMSFCDTGVNPCECYPCEAEATDFFACMGNEFTACYFDIIKDLEDDTTCEDLENSDFCEAVIGGCGASVINDCLST